MVINGKLKIKTNTDKEQSLDETIKNFQVEIEYRSARAWQPNLVFLPGESHGQRSPEGYSSQGHKEQKTAEVTEHAHTQNIGLCEVQGRMCFSARCVKHMEE